MHGDEWHVGQHYAIWMEEHGFLGQHSLNAKAIHHYEDLLRIPFIVRQPGTVPADRVSQDLQNLVDLPKTFLVWRSV